MNIVNYSIDQNAKNATWLILSYPRSGNHLFRAGLEYLSRQPTFGCPESPKDTPIYLRNPNVNAKLISVSNPNPIGVKGHTALDVFRHSRQFDFSGIALITRNPNECISSHLARKLRKKWWLSDREIAISVDEELSTYIYSVQLFGSFQKGFRRHIQFEELVTEQYGAALISETASNILGEQKEVSLTEFKLLKGVARDSQESLDPRHQKLKARIVSIVQSKVDYDEILHFINE